MIISHQHKYLFVEMPYTASTAISQELCQHYGGQSILHKHARYREFLRVASEQEKQYFVFASVRNPLDVVVTFYFKQKTDHQGFFTDPKYWQRNGGHVSDAVLERFKFIREQEADFPTYFKRFYRLPYDAFGSPSPEKFDFIVRYESLQSDFSKVLEVLRLEQIRPLPVINRTSEKGSDFQAYYTPDTYDRARRVFGPFLRKWNYDFPSEWENVQISRISQIQFELLAIVRRRLIWSSSIYARWWCKVRQLG